MRSRCAIFLFIAELVGGLDHIRLDFTRQWHHRCHGLQSYRLKAFTAYDNVILIFQVIGTPRCCTLYVHFLLCSVKRHPFLHFFSNQGQEIVPPSQEPRTLYYQSQD